MSLLTVTFFPDYKFLNVFGCFCFPHLRPYNSNKLTMHFKQCIFLCYSTSHKGYRFLDSTGRIYISKDVRFNKCRFPYTSMFPNSKSILVSTPSTMSFFGSPSRHYVPLISVGPNTYLQSPNIFIGPNNISQEPNNHVSMTPAFNNINYDIVLASASNSGSLNSS